MTPRCKKPPVADFPDSHKDLLGGQVATLATIGRDDIPQLTEVWFLHEDGELKISLNTSRLKTKNLIKRPQRSLFLLDLDNPFRYLDVRGRVGRQNLPRFRALRRVVLDARSHLVF